LVIDFTSNTQITEMNTASFFRKIRTYHDISEEAELAWTKLLHQKSYKKGENFITEGQKPRKVAFVAKGLFSQYYTADNGDIIIKYFFPEERLAASVSAMLNNTPGIFTITAIENTTVLEYDFFEFKKLFTEHPALAKM
jgi:CRP-like cAMP-binding protein